MDYFAERLFHKIQEKDSVLCVGLDPIFEKIPQFIREGCSPTQAIEDFLMEILDAVEKHCVCVKPNLAFFEVWGSEGWKVLENVSEQAKAKGLMVIADAKRGDIGSTAEQYAEAFLSTNSPFDAITINPYLGEDGILPFANKAAENGKAVFVLVKTSNPSAGEFQDLPVGDSLLHEEVARSVARIGGTHIDSSGFSSIGAVVGASYPEDLRLMRSEMPAQILLVPGFGAQGGSAEDVAGAFYKDGRGAIVNSSRGILFAGDGRDFAERATSAAETAKLQLNLVRKRP